MLAQAVPGGHAAAQAVVAVLDSPAGRLAVDPLQKTCRGGDPLVRQGQQPGASRGAALFLMFTLTFTFRAFC